MAYLLKFTHITTNDQWVDIIAIFPTLIGKRIIIINKSSKIGYVVPMVASTPTDPNDGIPLEYNCFTPGFTVASGDKIFVRNLAGKQFYIQEIQAS